LNRYFGKTVNGELITAGIEMEQSSTPEIVKKCQREMIEAVYENTDEALKILEQYISRIRSGEISYEDLVIEKKITRDPSDYKSTNRSAEAAKRMKRKGVDIRAGQKIRYIVRDTTSKPRILLDFEEIDRYDKNFYIEQLQTAAESVLRPFNAGSSIKDPGSRTLTEFS